MVLACGLSRGYVLIFLVQHDFVLLPIDKTHQMIICDFVFVDAIEWSRGMEGCGTFMRISSLTSKYGVPAESCKSLGMEKYIKVRGK